MGLEDLDLCGTVHKAPKAISFEGKHRESEVFGGAGGREHADQNRASVGLQVSRIGVVSHEALEVREAGISGGRDLLIEAAGVVGVESPSDRVREGVNGAGVGQVVVREAGLARVYKYIALVVSVGETALRAPPGTGCAVVADLMDAYSEYFEACAV